MTHVLALLAVALFTVAVAVSAGLPLLKATRFAFHRAEALFLAFISGSAVLSLAVYLLTWAGWAYKPVLLGLGLGLLLLGAWHRKVLTTAPPQPSLPRPIALLGAAVFLVYAALYLPHALLPDTQPDALSYHLAFPARDLAAHHFLPRPGTLYAGMPQGIEMVYLFAYAFGRLSAPALIHLAFAFSLPLGILAYAKRYDFGIPGLAAGLFVLISPIVGRTSTTAYVDVALAAVAFALFVLLQLWLESRNHSLLPLAGLLAGFAFDIKYTAGLALPYLLLTVLFAERKRALRPALLLLCPALLLPAPTLIRNSLSLSNPLSPVANRLFPNPVLQPWFEDAVARGMRQPKAVTPAEIPLELTVRGLKLTGVAGPLFLLSPFALLALRKRQGRQLLLAALVFGAAYPASTAARFLIPVLPFLSLALALAFSQASLLLLLAHALLSYPTIMERYLPAGVWRLGPAPWRDALGHRTEAALLTEAVPAYPMAALLNAKVPPSEPVLCLADLPQYFSNAPLLYPARSSQAATLQDILEAALKPLTHRLTLSFPPAQSQALRLTASLEKERWRLAELRLQSQGQEIPRQPSWHLRTSSNIWDTPFAFDGNPVTFFAPGDLGPQHLELHLPTPQTLDTLVLDTQPGLEIQLEIQPAGQPWRPVNFHKTQAQPEAPPRLRQAATDALNSNGIAWILADDREPLGRDFAARPLQWGLTLAAQLGPLTLYHLDAKGE